MDIATKVQSELEYSDRVKQLEVTVADLQQSLVAEQGKVSTLQRQTSSQDEGIAQQVRAVCG